MHKMRHAYEEDAPCNAYCHEGIHVDVAYEHPGRCRPGQTCAEKLSRDLRLQPWHAIEVLSITPVAEARSPQERYPENTARLAAWGVAPEDWQAFRVTYRCTNVA